MKTITHGLMAVMLMNLLMVVQNRDGVCFIVHVATLNVLTQTLQEDVHSVLQNLIPYGLEPIRYRLVQSIMTL